MFSDPEKNIAQLGLREGDHVADLGAGVGYYAAAAGRAVGTSGQVYAVEVQKELLNRLQTDLQNKKVHNVKVVWGDIEHTGGTRLRDNTIDAVLICNVLFQVQDRSGLLEEAKRILKPGGRILLIDWADSFGGMGPQAKDIVPMSEAQAMFERSGFDIEERHFDAGAHHYGFIATLKT